MDNLILKVAIALVIHCQQSDVVCIGLMDDEAFLIDSSKALNCIRVFAANMIIYVRACHQSKRLSSALDESDQVFTPRILLHDVELVDRSLSINCVTVDLLLRIKKNFTYDFLETDLSHLSQVLLKLMLVESISTL